MASIDQCLYAGLSAVADACRVARTVQHGSGPTRRFLKGDQSPVTVADFAAQAVVCRRLQSALGELLLAGEESSADLRGAEHGPMREAVVQAVRQVWPPATEPEVLDAIDLGSHDAGAAAYWTLDPVDGTKGFLRGGQYAVSLAFIAAGGVQLGILGCPNLSADFARPFSDPDPVGLIYYAVAGQGCWVVPADDVKLRAERVVAASSTPNSTVRVCESVESSHSRPGDTARVVARLGGAASPARLDSQCKYAVVARGQADAYLRLPARAGYIERIWDHAAGSLIAQEAGATVTDVDGKPLDFSRGQGLCENRGIVCATPRFHGPIIEAIRALRSSP
ncbi:MAG: 3'(2'),5'-bisphosphate nucleotidase [Gammaproteobacteria bacterium]